MTSTTMIHIEFPLQAASVAIILNGDREAMKLLQSNHIHYELIVFCDGAWHDAINALPAGLLTTDSPCILVALGDGDSIVSDNHIMPPNFIKIDDNNTTDFEKALQWIINNHLTAISHQPEKLRSEMLGTKKLEAQQTSSNNLLDIDVYWANGGSLDHTLGNLALAAQYANQLTCHFYTDNQYYRYINADLVIGNAKGKTFSLFPYPTCTVKKSTGVVYPMLDYAMQVDTQQSLRNEINNNKATVEFADKLNQPKQGCFAFVTL